MRPFFPGSILRSRLFPAFLLVGLMAGHGRADWTQVTGDGMGPADEFLERKDTLFALVGGPKPGVHISLDHGYTWIEHNQGLNRAPAVTIGNPARDLYVGTIKGVYRWSPEQASWALVSDSTHQIFTVGSYGDTVCYSAVEGFFVSVDKGSHWIRRTFSSPSLVKTIFVTGTRILLGMAQDPVFVSSDLGLTWSKGIGSPLYVPRIVAAGSDLFANTAAGLYRSSNGGDTWSPTKITNTVQALAAAGTRLLICNASQLYISSDLGGTWVEIPAGRYLPSSVLALSGPNLLITEYYPQGIRTTSVRPFAEMTTGVIPSSGAERLAPAFASDLSSVLPMDAYLDIRMPERAEVRLKVLDLNGREKAILAEGAIGPGVHRVALHGAGLTSGLYILLLESAATRISRPILLHD